MSIIGAALVVQSLGASATQPGWEPNVFTDQSWMTISGCQLWPTQRSCPTLEIHNVSVKPLMLMDSIIQFCSHHSGDAEPLSHSSRCGTTS